MRERVAAGFTLIEILVVVVVIGIGAGLIIVNLDSDDRRAAEREATRLASALEHAAALAQWRNATLGVAAEGRNYRFLRRGTDGQWQALVDDDMLAPRTLPEEIVVRPVSYATAPVAADAVLPFRPSGRNEPYALLLATPAWSVVIAGDPLNRVEIAAHAVSP